EPLRGDFFKGLRPLPFFIKSRFATSLFIKKMEYNMQCKCGGVLVEGKSTYRTTKKNFTFILENIPALKCMRCDEVQFTEEITDKLQKLTNRIERDSDEILKGRPSANLYD